MKNELDSKLLGQEMRRMREAANVTAEAMAFHLGISPSTYVRKEKGEVKIFATELVKFCSYLTGNPTNLLLDSYPTQLSYLAKPNDANIMLDMLLKFIGELKKNGKVYA